jgi:glycosyltransferase involved in cell wall biosynthesis
MKVAFFAEILIKDFDGASRTMFQLIERIPKQEFEFLFVCGMHQNDLQETFQVLKVPTLQVPGNATYRFSVPTLKKKSLEKQLLAFNPDVIHIATPSFLGNFGLKFAQKHNLPVITIYHTHFISYMDYYLKSVPFLINPTKKLIQNSYNSFYNKTDIIYIPSESISQELTKGGVSPKPQKIWKRGIDLSLFSPEKRSSEFIQEITGNSQKNILFSSRLVWEKNLKVLIELYRLVEDRKLPYNIIVAGSGVAEEECRKLMPKAFFLGHTDHSKLSRIYASADVFMFPSVTETFGNVVLEAMASGLPCVIANGGGSKDFIRPGENGFLCEPENAKQYLKYIELILNDEVLADKIATKSIEYSKTFDWDYLAAAYFEDLNTLARKV